MSIFSKLKRAIFGGPDFAKEVEFLRWHYDYHLYSFERFSEHFEGRFTAIYRRGGAAPGAVFRCTRDQLVAMHAAKNIGWSVPARIAYADFTVKSDYMLSVKFYEVGEAVQ